MRLLRALLLSLLGLYSAFGQDYTISTFAGALPENIPGPSAALSTAGVTVDSAGNVYMTTAFLFQLVLKLDASSAMLTPVAGNGTFGFSGDNGPALNAEFALPRGIAIDSSGTVYVADVNNGRIRRVANGVIATVAGNGRSGYSGDGGPAISAQLSGAGGVAVDAAGNLYITDTGNNCIRKVSNGQITTIAGNAAQGFSGDSGPATSAQLNKPSGVAIDSAGNLYIADTGNNVIRKVSGGVITTIAGNGTQGFSGDGGAATSAQLSGPVGVAVDGSGNVYIADAGNSRIRKISNGIATTAVGGGTAGLGDSGPATQAQLIQIGGVAVDVVGNLYVASNTGIRKVANGIITTVAGNGSFSFSGDNGPAISAQMYYPSGVAKDAAGNVYIADYNNSRIRKVANGIITTVAGTAVAGFSGDNGPATNAQLRSPADVAVDSSGSIYIADLNNNRIRKISNGVITTVAGNGTLVLLGHKYLGVSATQSQAYPEGI